MKNKLKRVNLIIEGKVQGVSFRAYTKFIADYLGIIGYVQNLNNGTVKIVAEGSEEKINELINYCRNGPKLAVVKNIQIKEERPKGSFKNFQILYF